MASEPVDTVVAGRTDAGVHARHNVVSFTTDAELDPDRVRRSLTAALGPEIVVTAAAVVPDGFHARFSASERSYRYTVDDSGAPDPLRRHSVWAVDWPLDVASMDAAAQHFVGEHDFDQYERLTLEAAREGAEIIVWPETAVPGILEARDRNAARGAAPAHGLVLWNVAF